MKITTTTTTTTTTTSTTTTTTTTTTTPLCSDKDTELNPSLVCPGSVSPSPNLGSPLSRWQVAFRAVDIVRKWEVLYVLPWIHWLTATWWLNMVQHHSAWFHWLSQVNNYSNSLMIRTTKEGAWYMCLSIKNWPIHGGTYFETNATHWAEMVGIFLRSPPPNCSEVYWNTTEGKQCWDDSTDEASFVVKQAC